MRKKIILQTFSLLFALPFSAQTISREAAVRIAAKYIDKVPSKKSIRKVLGKGSQPSEQSYHIFNDNDGEGFVIVAGDGRMNEVVGYSKTGRIDVAQMPEGLRAYLSDYKKYVTSLRKSDVAGRPVPTDRGVEPLLKTKWNQMAPYNDLAPRLGEQGRRPPIGCVATAVSQVMNYHKWPLQGKGNATNNPHYKSDAGDTYGKQEVDFTSSFYQWDKMTETCRESAESRSAVARLMYDVSVGVQMEYGPTVSAAKTKNAVKALENYFDYKVDCVQRDYLSSTAFFEILRTELREGFPVIFSGGLSTGRIGHTWVCDGYDKEGLFSMNWGWGGASDGFFDLSYLNPSLRGAGGGEGGFFLDQEFIRIRPNKEGVKEMAPRRRAFDFNLLGSCTPDKEVTTRSEGLTLKLDGLGNFCSSEEFSSRVGIAIFKNLDEKEISVKDLGDEYAKRTLSFEASFAELKGNVKFDTLSDGIYYLYPVTMTTGEQSWHKTGRPCYVKIQVQGNEVKVIERADKPALKLMEKPEGSLEIPGGMDVSYTIHLANTSTMRFYGLLKAVLKGSDNKLYPCEMGGTAFRFMDNTDERRNVHFVSPADIPTGEYDLEFVFEREDWTTGQRVLTNCDLVQLEQPLKIKVWNTSENAYLRCLETCITNGYVAIDDEVVDLNRYPDAKVFVRTENVGKKKFEGELRYLLKDLETNNSIELERVPYVMQPKSWTPETLKMVSLGDKHSAMMPGHTYSIVVEAYSGNKRIYEWGNQQRLTVGHVATGITDKTTINCKMAYYGDNKALEVQVSDASATLSVYSVAGTLVIPQRTIRKGKHIISLEDLPPAVYVVVLIDGKERQTLRVVR